MKGRKAWNQVEDGMKSITVLGRQLGLWDLVFITSLLTGALIRIYCALTQPIYIDENFYSYDGHLLEQGHTPFQDYPTRSPLIILLSAGILRLGGDIITLRLTAVLFSVATGVLIFRTGQLLSNKRIGALASAIFFLSPYSIRYGYIFFTNPFSLFFVGLSFYLLMKGMIGIFEAPDKRLEGNNSVGPSEVKGSHPVWRYRAFILSGVILGLAVFIRRNSLSFYPAVFLILVIYTSMSNRSLIRSTELRWSLLTYTIGFLIIFIPGVLFILHLTGTSFTTYFFYSDFIENKRSIIYNMIRSFTLFKTRGYYFIATVLIFFSLVIMKGSEFFAKIAVISSSVSEKLRIITAILLIIGWMLAGYTLLGSNYNDSNGGWIPGVLILLTGLSAVIIEICHLNYRQANDQGGSGKLIGSEVHQKIGNEDGTSVPDSETGSMGINSLYDHIPLILWAAVSLILIILAGEQCYLASDAIILLSLLSILLLFIMGLPHWIDFSDRRIGHPSLWLAAGVYTLSVVGFYILFRVKKPYYYDILLPLSLITALLFDRILLLEYSRLKDTRFSRWWDRSQTGKIRTIPLQHLVGIAQSLFVLTLLLTIPISISEYRFRDDKGSDTDLRDMMDTAEYLDERTDPDEEIFTAKAVIALQADVDVIFNIVRPTAYRYNRSEALEQYGYPTIEEITEYLDSEEIRFIIVDWVFKTYFLEVYPEFNEYIISYYSEVEQFGEIEVWERI